jgi:hypothetical protein
VNIFLTNVLIAGQPGDDDSPPQGDDMMVFTRLSADTIANAFGQEGSVTFDECYAVRDDELQFYLYEPCHLSPAEEGRAIALADQRRARHAATAQA